MVTSEAGSIQAAAARNNAGWCASVCRSHGIPYSFGEMAWSGARRTPPYYPDAVTLHPDAVPGDFLSRIDTDSPGCSVKDSFAALDLAADGFIELFTARWIHRPAGPAAAQVPGRRAERVREAGQLRDWVAAWHGADAAPDIFRPALLDDPSVSVTALYDGEDLAGGFVLNRGSGVVGLSNLFAVDGGDVTAVWSSAINAAANHSPGHPLVGYEGGEALAPALASGFVALGALRVWLRNP